MKQHTHRIAEYLDMLKGESIEVRSRFIQAAVRESDTDYLEILVRQMNEDVSHFPEKPKDLDITVYTLLKRMYYGYLENADRGKGETKVRVYTGDINTDISRAYNELCHCLAAWKKVPSLHIQICNKIFCSNQITFEKNYNRVGNYEKNGCIFPREMQNNQQRLFHNHLESMNEFEVQTQEDMSKFGKGAEPKKEKEVKQLPEHLDFGCGMANLVQTPNGFTIIELKIPFEDISNRIEQENVFSDVSQFAGWETSKGELWLKLKGIPLKNAKEDQTHFLKLDYFVPENKES